MLIDNEHDAHMVNHESEPAPVGGLVRLLALLFAIGEPLGFALVASGAFNAIRVRGTPVVLMLLARLTTTALGVAAGRALLDRQASAPALARAALVSSAAVQLVAYLSPWFPSNRLPGETPMYVTWTLVYYGGWLVYLRRSKRIAALYG